MFAKSSTGGRNRTFNPRFWRPVLCQLSYARVCIQFALKPPDLIHRSGFASEKPMEKGHGRGLSAAAPA